MLQAAMNATLRHDTALEGWLLRIATTVALDHLRRRRGSARPAVPPGRAAAD
jgi:DNA-directed RNA polymerase specialized sigma24 family protein